MDCHEIWYFGLLQLISVAHSNYRYSYTNKHIPICVVHKSRSMFYFLMQNIFNKELLNEQIFSMYSYFPVDPCICMWTLMPSLAFIHTHTHTHTHTMMESLMCFGRQRLFLLHVISYMRTVAVSSCLENFIDTASFSCTAADLSYHEDQYVGYSDSFSLSLTHTAFSVSSSSLPSGVSSTVSCHHLHVHFFIPLYASTTNCVAQWSCPSVGAFFIFLQCFLPVYFESPYTVDVT
jgi:hypothetical protein